MHNLYNFHDALAVKAVHFFAIFGRGSGVPRLEVDVVTKIRDFLNAV